MKIRAFSIDDSQAFCLFKVSDSREVKDSVLQ